MKPDPPSTAEHAGLSSPGDPPQAPGPDEMPVRRDRGGTRIASTYGMFVAGIVLFAAVIIDPGSGGANAFTVISGALCVVLGAVLLAELVDPRPVAAVGLVGGAVLGISALAAEPIQGPEVGRLLAGALLLLGSGAMLASIRPRRDQGGPS